MQKYSKFISLICITCAICQRCIILTTSTIRDRLDITSFVYQVIKIVYYISLSFWISQPPSTDPKRNVLYDVVCSHNDRTGNAEC
jgi:hypothetical protein